MTDLLMWIYSTLLDGLRFYVKLWRKACRYYAAYRYRRTIGHGRLNCFRYLRLYERQDRFVAQMTLYQQQHQSGAPLVLVVPKRRSER